eukprot:7827877-Heterocapsa_arctica.AAC.1
MGHQVPADSQRDQGPNHTTHGSIIAVVAPTMQAIHHFAPRSATIQWITGGPTALRVVCQGKAIDDVNDALRKVGQRTQITWTNDIIKPGKQPLFRIALGTATEEEAQIQPISIFTIQLHGLARAGADTTTCKELFELEGPATEGTW